MELAEEQAGNLEAVFRSLDEDGDQCLNGADEVVLGLRRMGITTDVETIEHVLLKLDIGDDTDIDRGLFCLVFNACRDVQSGKVEADNLVQFGSKSDTDKGKELEQAQQLTVHDGLAREDSFFTLHAGARPYSPAWRRPRCRTPLLPAAQWPRATARAERPSRRRTSWPSAARSGNWPRGCRAWRQRSGAWRVGGGAGGGCGRL